MVKRTGQKGVKISRLILLLLVTVLLLVTLSADILAGEEIIYKISRTEVIISSPQIYLGDIGSFTGVSGQKLTELNKISLGRAPLPGYFREITRELISLILKEKGFIDIKLMVPEVVIVKTSSREIEGEKLLEEGRQFILNKLAPRAEGVAITPTITPRNVVIPDGEYSLKFLEEDPDKLIGNISLPIEIIVNGKVWRRIYLGYKVELRMKVLVATRNIKRGSNICKEDLALTTEKITGVRGEIINDFNDPRLSYSIVKIPLQKGEILTTDHLEQPVVIHWGDIVEAEVIVRNVKVSTSVKALGSGRVGDYVKVINPETGYEFKARVINSRLVRVVR
ncbi:flagellar basal body P-ring formation chaperone FlgA [Halothermothrix orenii]|uniref:Flagellar basal body P-ring biosynthesis protein n=1 Tax=Halothermothrix orenii (strain H 168 / OCM 544 / DSM 9562) TaxID=373903 RepID=B8CYN7_HALOH|nr:flagellar basal body P-ring formation chaperone FlgA [Halothermothrix orenii]ACL70406.1 Flagellar basal body P-ring biosynthesis protein [Halothermothrix orenii H 168]